MRIENYSEAERFVLNYLKDKVKTKLTPQKIEKLEMNEKNVWTCRYRDEGITTKAKKVFLIIFVILLLGSFIFVAAARTGEAVAVAIFVIFFFLLIGSMILGGFEEDTLHFLAFTKDGKILVYSKDKIPFEYLSPDEMMKEK